MFVNLDKKQFYYSDKGTVEFIAYDHLILKHLNEVLILFSIYFKLHIECKFLSLLNSLIE